MVNKMNKNEICDFRKITGQIVAELKDAHLADYLDFQVPGASGFKVLASQEVFDLTKILLLVSGIPEETGVWSYTLLQMGREDDSSMRPYFEMARNLGWGIIALNPHGGGIERGKSEYHLQMETVLGRLFEDDPSKTVVTLCFSAGGGMVFEYLNQHRAMAGKVSGAILIDTPPPPLLKRSLTAEVQALIKKTLLFGLEDEKGKLSMWARATASVLGIGPVPVKAAWHGELPNLLIDEVAGFLKRV